MEVKNYGAQIVTGGGVGGAIAATLGGEGPWILAGIAMGMVATAGAIAAAIACNPSTEADRKAGRGN